MGNYPPNNYPPVNGLDLRQGFLYVPFPFKGSFKGVFSESREDFLVRVR